MTANPSGKSLMLLVTLFTGAFCLAHAGLLRAADLELDCPGDITVSNDAGECGAIVNYTAPIGTGTATSVNTILLDGIGPGGFFPAGTSVETYAVYDNLGDTLTCSFQVTVEDTEAPVVNCGPSYDVTVPSAVGGCETQVNYVLPEGSDNCGIDEVQLVSGIASGGMFPIGQTFVDHIYLDEAGNQAFCRIIVTVLDSSGFELNCPGHINVEVATQCDTVVDYEIPTPNNLCPGYSVYPLDALGPGASFPVGTTTEVYGASVPFGDTLTCSFDVTVNEPVPPDIDCPEDTLIQAAPGDCEASFNFVLPAVSDNCDTTPQINQTAGPTSGGDFPVGTTTLEFEASDQSGNTATCSFDVTVEENTPPQISCPGDITVENDSSECGAIVSYTAPEGSDNCPGTSTVLTEGLGPDALFPVGSTTETYVVTDASGNADTCSFVVTVNDVEPPALSASDITQPNDVNACEAIVNYPIPPATDNCAINNVSLLSGPTTGSAFPLGTTTVTYQAVDDAGNTAQISFDVTVVDEEMPQINCLADVSLEITSGACDTIFNYTPPTFSDNCPGATIAQTAGQGPGGTFGTGTTTETYTVTDAAGNDTTCSFNVVVTESIPPVINCPGDTTVYLAPDSCQKMVTYPLPVVTDNCGIPSPTLVSGPPPGSLFSAGSTFITYEATDSSDNTVSCNFNVTVLDSTPPVSPDCGTPIVLNADADSCGITLNFEAPTTIDACGGPVSIAQTAGPSPGDFAAIGHYTIEYTLTDSSGNTSVCTRSLTINDTGAPKISCPTTTLEFELFTTCDSAIQYQTPSFISDCSPVDSSFTGAGSGAEFPLGSTTDTYQYTDTFGNTSTCEVEITLFESIPPVVNCTGDTAVNNAPGTCAAVVNYPEPTGTDNCSAEVTATLIEGMSPGNSFPVGTTTVSYQLSDESGNADTCTFDITVNDVEPPAFDCPDTLVFYTDNNQCGTTLEYEPPPVSDNCSDDPAVDFVSGAGSGTFLGVGFSNAVFAAQDGAGNADTCSFVIAVRDTTAPVFTLCPADTTAIATGSNCQAVVNFDEPIAEDGCDVTITQAAGLPAGSNFPIGNTEIVYEAEDEYGNMASCAFVVEVTEEQPPQFLSCPADIESCTQQVSYEAPEAEDNCSTAAVELTQGIESGSIFPYGETPIVFVATDVSGNTDTCSFTVTVLQAPSQAQVSADTAYCNTHQATLSAQIPEHGSGTWSQISGEGQIEDASAATTAVTGLTEGENRFVWTVSSNNGCPDNTDTLSVTIQLNVDLDTGEDHLIQKGQSVQLDAITSVTGNFEWTPAQSLSCTECENPVATPEETTNYQVDFSAGSGCHLFDSTRIKVLDYIPTGFTPDGDGTNDVWNIPGIEQYPNAVVKIFNRWGDKIFESTGYTQPWDGTYEGEDLPAASYFFTIDYGVANQPKASGTLTLIR